MHISSTEHVFGYDIRYFGEQPLWVRDCLANYTTIEKCCSYDPNVWLSRFIPALSDYDTVAEFAKDEFQNMSRFADHAYTVPLERSFQMNMMNLWKNLGNMLLRYGDVQDGDHIIAETFIRIEKPAIFCKTQLLSDSQTPNVYELSESEAIPDVLRNDEWRFLGYDTGESPPYSAMLSAFDAVVGQPSLREEIEAAEGYVIGTNRNRFGLHDNLATAVYECMLLNHYREDCPDFVYGLYEARNPATLSFFQSL